jgi:hypothetical protein
MNWGSHLHPRRPPRRALLLACWTAAAFVWTSVPAAERSHPVDCLPDRVLDFDPVAGNPASLFGATFVPGIVLGPPGDSLAIDGSFSVATLGFGGTVTLRFDDIVIEDRPGPDFIVFENAFFRLPLPASAADDFRIFAEPGRVEASFDGATWMSFPFDPQALQAVRDLPSNGDVDRALRARLGGLAGITPTFTGNWTVPDDPAAFDPSGTGGVSGAGGDAFDLADVGLAQARFIRITDGDTQAGFPGPGEGFDLDALVVLHGRPDAPVAVDSDGDRLSDLEEQILYGSNPTLADTDGDGTDDGREVAGCRNPASSSTDPFLLREPRLWAIGSPGTEWRWSFMGTGRSYDLIRGDLAAPTDGTGFVDLGVVDCLTSGDAQNDVRWACDTDLWPCALEQPESGAGYFYLLRVVDETGYGRSSNLETRSGTGACP